MFAAVVKESVAADAAFITVLPTPWAEAHGYCRSVATRRLGMLAPVCAVCV